MTVKALNSKVCRINYAYSSDYTLYGEKRFSWYSLRDKNVEFDVNHVYLVTTQEEDEKIEVAVTGSSCFICSDGDFSVLAYDEKNHLDYSGTIISRTKHSVCFNCSQTVTLTSTVVGGAVLILTSESVPELESKCNVITAIGNDVYLIEHRTDGNSIEIYDRELFSLNKLDDFLFVSDETFAFKNTFRGMYLHSGSKEQAQLITCTKGSAEIFVTDMRKTRETYLNSYSAILDNAHSLYVGKGMSVGVLSLSDETVVNRMHTLPHDRKYIKRVNISSCEAANKLDPDRLIMTVLDRISKGIEEEEEEEEEETEAYEEEAVVGIEADGEGAAEIEAGEEGAAGIEADGEGMSETEEDEEEMSEIEEYKEEVSKKEEDEERMPEMEEDEENTSVTETDEDEDTKTEGDLE